MVHDHTEDTPTEPHATVYSASEFTLCNILTTVIDHTERNMPTEPHAWYNTVPRYMSVILLCTVS